ncbi:MAG TPA: thymidylate synthase [archaeon]|nr:thymidylate synthase [archaeon]
MENNLAEEGRIPTLQVVADSIPQAHYRAVKAVWEQGARIRTEYDKKSEKGEFIDPPSRDARVLIEVKDPWKEPRYPPILHSEIGAYIAEIMGAKDHLVLSMKELIEAVEKGGVPEEKRWPYTYSGRLRKYPALEMVLKKMMENRKDDIHVNIFELRDKFLELLDECTINQIDLGIARIVETPYSRRAVMATTIPFIDEHLREDVPCLREIQLRAVEVENNDLVLNMNTMWRSRDLYKAWPDNVIGITFLQGQIARSIEKRSGRKTRVGSYADYSSSLHIYGSYFHEIEGDPEKGLKSFFERHDEKTFINMSMTSEQARDLLVLPELKELLTPQKIEEWKFGDEQTGIIETLINDLEHGKYLP